MKFSPRSQAALDSAHPDVQRLFQAVLAAGHDCTILVGHRGQEEQDECCRRGVSKTPWPTSKHNSMPSNAVDVMPYPIDWDDGKRLDAFALIVFATAAKLGIGVRWGGNFKSLIDKPHWELLA